MNELKGPSKKYEHSKKESVSKVEYIAKMNKGIWGYIKPEEDYGIKTQAEKKLKKVGITKEEVIEYLKERNINHAREDV